MFPCKICGELFGTEAAANYCATFSVDRPIYKTDEPVKAHSYTMHEETSGWRNATVIESYIEKGTHNTMYRIRFQSRLKGENWEARFTADRLKPLRIIR